MPDKRISDLSDAAFSAAFLLFSEGLRINPDLSRSPAVMEALHAFRNARQVKVKLPGEA